MLAPLESITAAQARIRTYLKPSPVHYAESYSERVGATVCFKLDLFLPTHAFKIRGGLNAILKLSPEQRERGVVTASGGNHGLGVAYAAKQTGTNATIFLPKTSPRVRAENIAKLGATVIVDGEDWNEANARALELSAERGCLYVSPFDDPDIIAGQGTMALEILEQVPDVEVIVCSVGGGGLISGIASAVRQLRPEVRVIGVETLGADCMSQSLAAGRVVQLPRFTSIAESLGTRCTTERQLAVVQEAVEAVVTVSDESALRELLFALNTEKLLMEPAASCTLAALTEGLVPDIQGKTVVPIICGGNITLEQVAVWLKRFEMSPTGQPLVK